MIYINYINTGNIIIESYGKITVSKPYFITSDDGVDNACVKISGYKKPCRGRSSMLILKNEDGIWKVFFYKDNEKGHEYHAPGGGWNKNESSKNAAIREAREECMMNVKDIKYSGYMIEYHDKVADWVKDHVENEDDWWYGYYSEIFVGMYDSKFTGKIADRDKDKEISSGKWYIFDDIKDDKGLPKEYKKAIENYISDNSYVNESSIVTEISRSDIKDSTIERGDSCYNLDRWPNDYNILFITGISGSGKTTLGTSMAKEFKCRRVELDYVAIYYLRKIHEKNKAEKFYNILKSECPEAVEFLDKNPVEKLGLREKWSDTGDILTDFCKWFISKVEGNGNSYIVNGAYLYQIFEPSFFYDKPVIIKDINIVKTAYRRVMRELVGDNGNLPDKLVSGYKALKTALSKPYRDANKDFKHFNKDMKHNADYNEACKDRATAREFVTFVEERANPLFVNFNDTSVHNTDTYIDIPIMLKIRDSFVKSFNKDFNKFVDELYKTYKIPKSKFIDDLYIKNNTPAYIHNLNEKEQYYYISIPIYSKGLFKKDEVLDTIGLTYDFRFTINNNSIKVNRTDFIIDDEDFEIIKESVLFNEKDIYYNKDKFDSGEINLCFITGHSGSGKSTMGLNATKGHEDTVDTYSLDDLQWSWKFSDDNLKEYGDLIYSFFNGSGKKYRIPYRIEKNGKLCGLTGDDVDNWRNKNGFKDLTDYVNKATNSFVDYAIKYSSSHKNKKFILEGIQLFLFVNPDKLKDYAVYIKGTSALLSTIRGVKRDTLGPTHIIDNMDMFYRRIKDTIGINGFESKISNYRKYFSDLIKKNEKEVTESVSNPYVYCGKPCRGN